MKLRIIIFSLFVPIFLWSQQITLEQCYSYGYYNHPSYDNLRVLLKIGEVEAENTSVNMLPQATLKANVSWQSDVTEVDLPIPGVNMPSIAHDWYKLYIDVTQTIYDGGVNRKLKQAAEAKTKTELHKQEVNLYAVKGGVNVAFFAALNLQKQNAVLNLKMEVLEKQIQMFSSAVKNGMLNQNELNNLLAEKVLLQQQLIELESAQKTALDNLSHITGIPISNNSQLVLPVEPKSDSISLIISRPELDLIDAQKEQLNTQSELLQKARKPKVYGYGQAGYGRPGLNMFNDAFDDWYVVGVGMQWKIYDWKETARKRELLVLQNEIIDNSKDNFLYQLNMLTQTKLNEIEKLKRIIKSDEELLRLRESVAENSASQLQNGLITSSEYIRNLNSFVSSQHMSQSHKIQLLKAQYEFKTLMGTELN